MSFTDQDLRDALEPLRGDPIADSARVLAALAEPAHRPLRPWLLALGATAAGALLGFAAGWAAKPAPEPEQIPVTATPRPILRASPASFYVATDRGDRELHAGATLEYEQFYRTGDRSPAWIQLPSGIDLRMASSTKVNVLNDRAVTLVLGQLCAQVPPNGKLVVETGEGEVLVGAGMTCVAATSMQHVIVSVLEGRATFRAFTGEERVLEGDRFCESEAGLVGEVGEVADRAELLAWQAPLLDQWAASETVITTLHKVVERLDSNDLAIAKSAEKTLRELGPLGARALGSVLWMTDPERRSPRALRVFCDIADHEQLGILATQLGDCPNGELRKMRAIAIERITGIASGEPPEFWIDATPSQRYEVLRRWRRKMGMY